MWEQAIKLAAEWTVNALAAARTREQQRLTNMVADAGVIVAGLRRLDSEFHRLYSPLMYFQPDTSDERRTTLTQDLIDFAHSNDVNPKVAGAIARLRSDVHTTDGQLLGLVDELALVAEIALTAPRVPEAAWDTPAERRLEMSGVFDDEDEPLRMELDDLLDLIRTCRDPECAAVLRDRIRGVVAAQIPVRERAYSERHIVTSPLRLRLLEAEEQFGALLGVVQQSFPGIPTPDWVWA